MKDWLELDGRPVGFVEDRTYWRLGVRMKDHHIRSHGGGFGIQTSLFERLKARGDVDYIGFAVPEKGLSYISHFRTWLREGEVIDLGEGPQVMLRDHFMWHEEGMPS